MAELGKTAKIAKSAKSRPLAELPFACNCCALGNVRGTMIAPVHSVAKFIFGDISLKCCAEQCLSGDSAATAVRQGGDKVKGGFVAILSLCWRRRRPWAARCWCEPEAFARGSLGQIVKELLGAQRAPARRGEFRARGATGVVHTCNLAKGAAIFTK
jgi:hypothetical protein